MIDTKTKQKEKIVSSSPLDKQHEQGKLSARERIDLLLDKDSFMETDARVMHRCADFGMEKKGALGDGVITGIGTINGKKVAIASQDFTVLGGSLSEMHGKKICKIMDLAIENLFPMVFINDSGGARVQEGIDALFGYGEIFYRNVHASGLIPQISIIVGPCAGGAVYSPAITDFIFMVKNTSYMFVTGPEIVKQVTFEDITKEELGGYKIHSEKNGVVDKVFNNDLEAMLSIRQFMKHIPQNNTVKQQISKKYTDNGKCSKWLDHFMPKESSIVYNMKSIIDGIFDEDSFYEIKESFAKNLIVGFARINGCNVGVVANQSKESAGCLDVNASCKGARFIRFCDAFNIPIISLVDVPGFLPGKKQETDGIIKNGAKLLYAYAESTVPRVTIVTRKAYGGAYIVMGSKHLGNDINFAWQQTEIAVMGAEGAVNLLYRKQLKENPDLKEGLLKEYNNKFSNPKIAAARGYIDDIIFPSQTREKIINSLYILQDKQHKRIKKKHGNIPL
ncbi:acyl-CoA carboxylase subunit beta [Anaplasmataceae bacterium AB001_6]|nr:acyl-CoA carboxylase subunit beta [Anaplasmataceae bacterium AB001_6]